MIHSPKPTKCERLTEGNFNLFEVIINKKLWLVCSHTKKGDKKLKNWFVVILIGFVICTSSIISGQAYAQSEDTSSSSVSIETQLNEILRDLNNLQETFKHERGKQPKLVARKLRLIEKKIDRAVKTTPPLNCFKRLKIAMKDFYELTSDVGTGIACGPPIIPTFFDREKDKEPLTINCLPPPDEGPLRAQLGDLFSEVYGLYDRTRTLALIDKNTNEIPDACEGAL